MEEYPLKYIKSKYILKQIADHVTKNKLFKIINYNKLIQDKLDIGIIDYKKYFEFYSSIEIEIIPSKNEYGKFINIEELEDRKYYHIYFNDNKKEIQNYFLNRKDNVSKINIKIDYQIKSFKKLFIGCSLIECICFKNFIEKALKAWLICFLDVHH